MVDLSKLKKKKSYVDRNVKKVSKRPSQVVDVFHDHASLDNTNSVRNVVTNPLDYPIEVYPIFTQQQVSGGPVTPEGPLLFNFELWINNKHWDSQLHTGISGFWITLPEWVRFHNPSFWNQIQNTMWMHIVNGQNGTDNWPSGTTPELMQNDLSWYIDNENSTPFTYWIIPGQQVSPDEELELISISNWAGTMPWDNPNQTQYFQSWEWSIGSQCDTLEDRAPLNVSLGGRRNIAIFPTSKCSGSYRKPENYISDGFVRIFRMENIRVDAYWNVDLFNVCMSSSKIKITDLYGDMYQYPNVVGKCTSDFMELMNVDTEASCMSMGGQLCPNGRECFFNLRDCTPPVDEVGDDLIPLPCNCRNFNCRDCFDQFASLGERLCCRQCCNPIDNIDNVVEPPIDVAGCTDRSACNYSSLSNVDDGSCWYPRDFGWCDCNENQYDECGMCGGNGIEWGQNHTQEIDANYLLFPTVGCCERGKIRTVYFDKNCDGIADSNENPFKMCQDHITSDDIKRYCLQMTDGECENCFVQVANVPDEPILTCSGKVDCAGLCDGNSVTSQNPITGEKQCCSKNQLDDCGVCFGDGTLCQCNPKPNIKSNKFKSGDYVLDKGCICGCTDTTAANYDKNANWPCGSNGDNSCYSKKDNIKNGCCWYFSPINESQ